MMCDDEKGLYNFPVKSRDAIEETPKCYITNTLINITIGAFCRSISSSLFYNASRIDSGCLIFKLLKERQI